MFDVKLDDNFRQKAQFYADRQKASDLASWAYSSILSRDYVCIMLLISALNSLFLKGVKIQNTFLCLLNLKTNRIK